MADWAKALPKILRHEGVQLDQHGLPIPGKTGYVNNPADPGGETNFGITFAEARANGHFGTMKDLPFSLVIDIYKRKYWDVVDGDEIPDQEIAEEVCDTAVNCGVVTVIHFVQTVLNCLNKQQTLYPDVADDGRMGPATISALKAALAIDGRYQRAILWELTCLQGARYAYITKNNPKLEAFFLGWILNRVILEKP